MSHLEFLQVLGYFLLTAVGCLSVGTWITSKLKLPGTLQTGVALLIGMGVWGNWSLVLGLLGQLSRTNLLFGLMIMVMVGVPQLLKQLKIKGPCLKHDFNSVINSPILFITISLIILTASSLYLTAMAPPTSSDELHYHFPEAREIVSKERIDLTFGGHYFYGNIPKFMEVVFASGLSIQGYSLAHAYNLLILLAFCLVVYGVTSTMFTGEAGAIAALAILWFDHFTWNATVGFIDSATAAYEISGLLLLLMWNRDRKDILLAISGMMMGIAFSIKYSPAPTYLFEIILLLYWLKRDFKKIFIFLGTTAIFCGFWYGKNLIRFGNPFYPLYFGHKGVANEVYLNLLSVIQQFEPKTWQTFWHLLAPYRSITQGNVMLLLILAPIALIWKKDRKYTVLLAVYMGLYCIYWFFLGTHQARFLAPGLVVAQILGSLVLSKMRRWQLILGTGMAFVGLMIGLKIPAQALWREFWATRLHIADRQYALGNLSEREVLHRNFGCQYDVIRYLEDNQLPGKIIDNWSAWHAPSVSYFATKNSFTTSDDQNPDVRYLFYSEKVKAAHLADPDPLIEERKQRLLVKETSVLRTAKLIYSQDECRLFLLQSDN